MNLNINGELVTVPKTIQTVSDLIAYYEFKNPVIIVEHNKVILDKSDHQTTEVADGDKIEFVQFVGGG